MGKKKMKTITGLMQQQMFLMMAWAMFFVIMATGISALIYFPIQAGYGSEMTMLFRSAMVVVLVLVPCKFLGDMRKLNRLNKSW
jgi:hypothetical protein